MACAECVQLARELSSATAEVSALSSEIAARKRDGEIIQQYLQRWITEARTRAYEALYELTEHQVEAHWHAPS
jgi:hypothetical protein